MHEEIENMCINYTVLLFLQNLADHIFSMNADLGLFKWDMRMIFLSLKKFGSPKGVS